MVPARVGARRNRPTHIAHVRLLLPILIFLALALLALLPAPLPAQHPGALAGRVVEQGGGAPVEMAAVELPATGARAWTDAAGRFHLRGLEPGEHRVRVSRAGFAAAERMVEVRNGAEAWIDVALAPDAVVLASVDVRADADPLRDGTRITRDEIEAAGARTAADALEGVAGVVVRGAGAGGPRTVGIRGSAPDAVLVLVDGAPLNDPVSGEADLSAVPASSIEAIDVVPGAQSARYGPRAAAGVILIRTRAGEVRRAASLSAGALGERGARAEWGAAMGDRSIQAGGEARRMDGAFDFVRDAHDGTVVRRANADLAEWSGFAALAGRAAGGELRLRAGIDGLARGLPGTGHTPSLHARQEMLRARASAAWRGGIGGSDVAAVLSAADQRVRYADPAPPFGLAYHDTTRVRLLTARVEATHAGRGAVRAWGGGMEATVQRIDAALSDEAPRTRGDGGAFVHAAAEARVFDRAVTLNAGARMDRDGVTGGWYGSRALAIGIDLHPVRLQLASRSSFSPPSLGDQFFRAGVGVEPNPELRPERVPNEWELGASFAERVGGAEVSAHAAAYVADVRGMIVWLPDFTGRWSPRNVDAERRGMDGRAEVALPAWGLRMTGSYALARVTRDDAREGDVQLPYRPRHTASLGARWTRGGMRIDLRARYTGARNPQLNTANTLPGYWTTEIGAARDWRIGRWIVTTAVDVDRALDETGALIAGHPEPGRRVRLDVRVLRAPLTPTVND